MKRFYITTTAPYVNSAPHIGFAFEIITADILARYKRLLGFEVAFGTGTDEHGVNIYRKAEEVGLPTQTYVDKNAETFMALKSKLNLSLTHFQRTTNPDHIKAAQDFWKRCDIKGDIYKKLYQVKYCTGCELEKTDSELIDGRCPLHPTKELETINEENYFFRFSKYQASLLKLYEQSEPFVLPETKLKEIRSFVAHGLKDFSISRLREKMPWGVPVPGDDRHVMYVWFDALVFYISTLGWPDNLDKFQQFWPGVQIAGKDNLRQQAAMWQAMLLSAELPSSTKILINGFISVDGQKMSKTLGNVISPEEMLVRYGVEATRFLLTHLGPVNGDIDVSWEKFDALYQSALANGLGNTIHRVATLCQKSQFEFDTDTQLGFSSQFTEAMETYKFDVVLDLIWEKISQVDKIIQETKPWEVEGNKLELILIELVARLKQVAHELQPFMPETSDKITNIFNQSLIKKPLNPMFPRLT